LHFDHCGGGVHKNGDKLELTFPNATYWSNEAHWNWATKPNPREKPSFLSENILPMQESGHLKLIKPGEPSPIPGMKLFYSSGHTDNMMIPMIDYKGTTVCFMADLVPSVTHLPVSYIMSYDVRPLVAMDEKQHFLQQAMEKKYVLFFEHDPYHECCTLVNTEKGVRPERTFALKEL
jgi:glyoxylase-like metal-dependent hydrolase (beta-lactamase superfamily II)